MDVHRNILIKFYRLVTSSFFSLLFYLVRQLLFLLFHQDFAPLDVSPQYSIEVSEFLKIVRVDGLHELLCIELVLSSLPCSLQIVTDQSLVELVDSRFFLTLL